MATKPGELHWWATAFGLRRVVTEGQIADGQAWRDWLDWVINDYFEGFRTLAQQQAVSMPATGWAESELEMLNAFLDAGGQAVPGIAAGDPGWREGLERLTERARSVEEQSNAQPLGEIEGQRDDVGVALLSTVTDSLVLCLFHGIEHPQVASSPPRRAKSQRAFLA
jgi:hypothetical protein